MYKLLIHPLCQQRYVSVQFKENGQCHLQILFLFLLLSFFFFFFFFFFTYSCRFEQLQVIPRTGYDKKHTNNHTNTYNKITTRKKVMLFVTGISRILSQNIAVRQDIVTGPIFSAFMHTIDSTLLRNKKQTTLFPTSPSSK